MMFHSFQLKGVGLVSILLVGIIISAAIHDSVFVFNGKSRPGEDCPVATPVKGMFHSDDIQSTVSNNKHCLGAFTRLRDFVWRP